MPSVGIEWWSDYRYGPVKLLIGHSANQYVQKTGGINGWYTKPNESRIIQLVADRLPQSMDELKHVETSKGIGSLLLHRAGHCLPNYGNDEMKRFLLPSFVTTYNAVVNGTEKLSHIRLQELQEERIRMQYTLDGGGPGVYVGWNAQYPDQVYVGKSVNPADRKHTNASHFIWQIWATQSYRIAGKIETHIHRYLGSIGQPIRAKSRGLFILPGPKDALTQTLRHIDTHYRELFYNRCIMEGNENEHLPYGQEDS